MAKLPSPTPRFRFSLLALFGFVASVALCCAALVRPTEVWAMSISAVSLVLLVFAVLSVIYGQRSGRAFWVGFAIVGWACLGAQHFEAAEILPTKQLARKLQTVMHPPQYDKSGKVLINQEAINHFPWIARCLWPIILGFVGGLVARHLYLRRERTMSEK